MKWLEARLLGMEQVGVDELRNPVMEPRPMGIALVRITPWATAQGQEDGNPFLSVYRTFMTRKPAESFEGVRWLEVCGDRYEVDGIARAGSMTMVSGKRCKP